MSTKTNSLADRVRLALETSGISQAELARAIGVTPPTISGWLNGSTQTLRSKTALPAAQILGVAPLWLAEGKGPMAAEEQAPSVLLGALTTAESLFVQSVASALEKHNLPSHAMQTILMIIEASPAK